MKYPNSRQIIYETMSSSERIKQKPGPVPGKRRGGEAHTISRSLKQTQGKQSKREELEEQSSNGSAQN